MANASAGVPSALQRFLTNGEGRASSVALITPSIAAIVFTDTQAGRFKRHNFINKAATWLRSMARAGTRRSASKRV